MVFENILSLESILPVIFLAVSVVFSLLLLLCLFFAAELPAEKRLGQTGALLIFITFGISVAGILNISTLQNLIPYFLITNIHLSAFFSVVMLLVTIVIFRLFKRIGEQ